MCLNSACKQRVVGNTDTCQYSLYDSRIFYEKSCGNCHLTNKDVNLYGLKNIYELSKFDSIYIRMKILDSKHQESIPNLLKECEINNTIFFIKDYARIYSEPIP